MSHPEPSFSFEKFRRVPLSISGQPADPADESAFDYFDVLIVRNNAKPKAKSIFVSIPDDVRQFDPAAETLEELCITQGWNNDGVTPDVFFFSKDGMGTGCLSIHRLDGFDDTPDSGIPDWYPAMTLPAAAKLLGLGTYVFAEQLEALGARSGR